jgi:cell division protein FtsB|tara:strand:- start:5551 stop:6297 length:747 start_codon:yes stop_codon:yes gene_type:complete
MPNVVKGSKQEQMVVVPYRPRRRALFITVLVSVVAASVVSGFLYGYCQGLSAQGAVQDERDKLKAELSALRIQNTDLSRQVAILDRSSMVDQRATVEVQATIRNLREQLAQLQQDVVFYRQVVSSDTVDTGLIVGQMNIYGTSDPGRFRYKLVMRQQDADGDSYLRGHVNVNLVGRRGDEQMIFALRDISDEQDQLDIRLGFKYFQTIEGELALPAGFEPERIQIVAVATEPVGKSIDQYFSWMVLGD